MAATAGQQPAMADRQIQVAGEVRDGSSLLSSRLTTDFTHPFEAQDTDLYHILGVPEDSEPDQIKWAYRRLLLQYHPDKNKEAPAWVFQKLTHAKDVLLDPQRRGAYDRGEFEQTGEERGCAVDVTKYDTTSLEESIDHFFEQHKVDFANDYKVRSYYFENPGDFRWTNDVKRMWSDPKSYFCLGLPDREKDCTVEFWAGNDPCNEQRVHLYFDRILRDWLDKNEHLFRRREHPLLGVSATPRAVGQELAATTLLTGEGAIILSGTNMDPISASFLLACKDERERMSEKFDIKREDMDLVAQGLNWEAVLKCAILRRELLLEEKLFEADVWIPSTKKECREIVEEQVYRKIHSIQLKDDGDATLERLLNGIDMSTYVKRKVQKGVKLIFF